MQLTSKLIETIAQLDPAQIPGERRRLLHPIIGHIRAKVAADEITRLNFICTHNSRRSQLAQVWAQTAAYVHQVDAKCYSGGIEVTAFDIRAIEVLRKAGFRVSLKGVGNPTCFIFFSDDEEPVSAFSKHYDDTINPQWNFAAIMTCSHAEDNCPFIPGAEKRISLPYEDPGKFDDTPMEDEQYQACSWQIANEMFYIFSQISG